VTINFAVPQAGRANLGVYSASGSLVRTLVNSMVGAGNRSVTWNRTDNSGRRVANGSYFYRLTVNGKTTSAKSIIVN
jgi:flagellar hook assembly protein FlgD